VQDILIIGSGPAGLAVAAEASRNGLRCGVIEKGSLVNSITHYPSSMQFFSPTQDFELAGFPFITQTGFPLRDEVIRYYQRSARRLENTTYYLKYKATEVVGADKAFLVKCINLLLQKEAQLRSRKVVVASGCFDQPRDLQIRGEDLPHVRHYYHEPWDYEGLRVVVVGGGDSALEASIELAISGARVSHIYRGKDLVRPQPWLKERFERLVSSRKIEFHPEAHLLEIREDRVLLQFKIRGEQNIPCEAVLILTGYRPNDELLQKVGLTLDFANLTPVFFPETCETNINGIYVAGSLLAGTDFGTIGIDNYKEHAQVIVKDIQSKL
jgi:thioredoxin reductase (NADPH)